MQAVRQRRTIEDNSRGMAAPKRATELPRGARVGLVLAGVAGVAALFGATAATVIRITVGTTTRLANLDTELSGWERHGPPCSWSARSRSSCCSARFAALGRR
jgi:hypothetical protein